MLKLKPMVLAISVCVLSACQHNEVTPSVEIVGTKHPFAAEALYFLMTDRFVDGDPTNNHPEQGGEWGTYQRKLVGPNGQFANVGYMGGDYQGILNNLDYIKDMGFTAIWLSPIVDNPDYAFDGGDTVEFSGWGDGGKTGYHGYWATNFYKEDEHWGSTELNFSKLAAKLDQAGVKTVLDIVANHGSPSYMGNTHQPGFGEIYDASGKLIADHQNLHPEDLDPNNNPFHAFFHPVVDPHLAQLSNFNEQNPDVQDYLIDSYLYWIEQGADALRLDTVKHMPHSFWKLMSDRIRAKYPDYFMFGESYNWKAEQLAEHTKPENGGMSVLDFAGRAAMQAVFENKQSDYADILSYLHLEDGVYQNPYELMTFYDNHDMSRLATDQAGFIDVNNWLFTSRGIPVVYYGSEMGFMAGTKEHQGNRNYFGQDNVEMAKHSSIYDNLKRVANLRKELIALQRGKQVNLEFSGNKASFLRVYQAQGVNQTVLVLLNKGDSTAAFNLANLPADGTWQNAILDHELKVVNGRLKAEVEGHSLAVFVFHGAITDERLLQRLQ